MRMPKFTFLQRVYSYQSYFRHNKQFFRRAEQNADSETEVLMELNSMCPAHISYSYFADEFSNKYKSKVIGYCPRVHNLKQKLVFYTKLLFKISEIGIYLSFGVSSFFRIKLTSVQKKKTRLLYNSLNNTLVSKDAIENLTVDGLLIGDLLYDSFLRDTKRATIDPCSRLFRNYCRKWLGLVVFWQDYFNSHDVRCVNVSHSVYDFAIPLRVALTKDIPAFQVSLTHAYRFSSENKFAYNDFFCFPDLFAELSESIQVAGKLKARSRIDMRFKGKVGVDMPYSTKSAYGNFANHRLIAKSPRKKILVAVHCFSDAPHTHGNNLFTDYYAWLECIGRLSSMTDYDWYIKTHPDFIPTSMNIVRSFITKYPQFNLLNSSSSHNQIIEEGIDVALTCYGTIGFEYAAMGIPVINASINNPHVAYNFNIHPRTVLEFEALILNLDSLNHKINIGEVYEYYFMSYIYNTTNLFFEDYSLALDKIGGYKESFTAKFYDLWLCSLSPRRQNEIRSSIKTFLSGCDFRMCRKHMTEEYAQENFMS